MRREEMPGPIAAALEDPLGVARARHTVGRRIVGIIGAGVPDAMVLAAGAEPLHLAPGSGPTPHADAFVPSESPSLKRLAEPALDGSLGFLDLLVVTRSEEWLYYALKEAVRAGVGAVPPLHLHDLVPSAELQVRGYNRRQMTDLSARLARVTGTPPIGGALATARAAIDTRSALLRDLQRLREDGRIAGTTALRVIAAARVMDPASFVEAITPWLEQAACAPIRPGPRLLLLPSEATDLPAIHRAVEEVGATVIREDSDWGARAAVAPPSEADPDQILEAEIAQICGPAVQPRSTRLGWAEAQLARNDIDGVIFAIPSADRRFGWDYPSLRDRAATLGVPALLLRDDPAQAPEAARAALADFVRNRAGKARAA